MAFMMLMVHMAFVLLAMVALRLFMQSRYNIVLRDKALENLSKRQHELLKEKEAILNMQPGESQLVMNRIWQSKLNRYFDDLSTLSSRKSAVDVESNDSVSNVLTFPKR